MRTILKYMVSLFVLLFFILGIAGFFLFIGAVYLTLGFEARVSCFSDIIILGAILSFFLVPLSLLLSFIICGIKAIIFDRYIGED